MPDPASILKGTFGYDTFRPLQREVIDNVLAHRDTMAVMPTGGGKSLCYQIPALLQPGLTVVVSPLIALMNDQVQQMDASGVPALFLNSSLDVKTYRDNMARVRRGEVKLLYVAPETLLTERISGLLDSLQVDLLTVDEAHCISEWGHDFRPEYRQIVEFRKRFPAAACLALTATATPKVRADIKKNLGISGAKEFVASFNRGNLFIEVTPRVDGMRQAARFVEAHRGESGIIYCFSRKQVDELAATLARKGYAALPYHAGLNAAERRANQEAFIRDDAQIIVATIAFGMGINKPNVRYVLHFDLPKSIEGYYQEIGRAGRDGLPAHCLLLYSYADEARQRYFIDQKKGTERAAALKHLDDIISYAEELSACRRKPLLNYFGEEYSRPRCGNCDNCARPSARETGLNQPAQKFLSCVLRTGERFGAGHVTDVLRGLRSDKTLRYGHDQLSTFGIGKDLPEKEWLLVSRRLLAEGYLQQVGEYRVLAITALGRESLRSRAEGAATPPAAPPAQQSAPVTAVAKPAPAAPKGPEPNNALFALLRQKRKEVADRSGVPPYVVFSDRTLLEMAVYFPASKKSLLAISGVGQVKLERYGDEFLQVIVPFSKKHGLKEKRRKPKKAA